MRRIAVIAVSALAALGLTVGTADAATNHPVKASAKGAQVTGYWHWAKDSKGKTRRWLHTTIKDTAKDGRSGAICYTTGATKPTTKSKYSCILNTKGAGRSYTIAGWADFGHFWYTAASVKKLVIYTQSTPKKAW